MPLISAWAVMVQYGVGMNVLMVCSRVTRNLRVGPWTLPVLRVVYRPLACFAAFVSARDRLMP